jgi:hypothetical protein
MMALVANGEYTVSLQGAILGLHNFHFAENYVESLGSSEIEVLCLASHSK